jgi:hypothetical protein
MVHGDGDRDRGREDEEDRAASSGGYRSNRPKISFIGDDHRREHCMTGKQITEEQRRFILPVHSHPVQFPRHSSFSSIVMLLTDLLQERLWL